MKINISLKISIICCLTLGVCCSVDKNDAKINPELFLVNNKELLKVLNHYSAPHDSLKYKAAVYLINTMKNSYYLESSQFEKFSVVFDSLSQLDGSLILSSDHYKNKEIRRRKFDQLWNYYKMQIQEPRDYSFIRYNDSDKIEAELLIENIEFAFLAWNLPWARNYSFDTFCKYILPYRVNNEPLEHWRRFFYEKTKWVIDSMKGEEDPVKVAVVLNAWLAKDYWGSDYLKHFNRGALRPTELLKGRIAGECYDQTVLGCSVMRAMGIATSTVVIPSWGKRSGKHEFNAIQDRNGKWIDFHAGDQNPGENILSMKPPKAFIKNVGSSKAGSVDENVLEGTDPYIDLTYMFNSVVDISIATKSTDKYAYLCTFDNQDWIPIYSTEIKNDSAKFTEMGIDMVYLPIVVENGKMKPISPPLLIDSKGRLNKLEPILDVTNSHVFTRKYPDRPAKYQRCKDLIGGRFQVADNPEFSPATDLYTITNLFSNHPRIVPISKSKKKYVRYIFPQVKTSITDGPSSIQFYTKKGENLLPLSGRLISSPGVSAHNLERIFDTSLLTYTSYTKYEKGLDLDMDEVIVHKGNDKLLWVGMELDPKTIITHISFCPRNDKNDIYPGMWYELSYWDSQWKSIARINATDTVAAFDGIPKNALLILRCLDEGQEQRIFTINDGRIDWY